MNLRTNQKLYEEIQCFVEKKIKDVKFADDIIINNRFHLSDAVHIDDIKESYQRLYNDKKVLQLTINLFNEYERYKGCSVMLNTEEINNTNPWASFYKFEDKNLVWKCIRKPSKEDIICILFDYILQFLSIERKENIVEKVIDNCTYCDEPIREGESECRICGAKVEDMIIPVTSKNTELKEMDENNTNLLTEEETMPMSSITNEEVYNEHSNDVIDSRDNYNTCESQACSNELRNVPAKVRTDIWICGKCGFYCDYLMANCGVCGDTFKNGTWKCGQCTKRNSCTNNVCDECGTRNVNIETEVVQGGNGRNMTKELGNTVADRGASLSMDNLDGSESLASIYIGQWHCGKCGVRQGINYTQCYVCKAPRAGSGRWECDKCSWRNKFSDAKCTTCGYKNDSLTKKICKSDNDKTPTTKGNGKQKSTTVVDSKRTGYWKCEYSNCRSSTDAKEDYCRQCHIYRYFSRIVGDAVGKMKSNKLVYGWICHGCTKFNDLSKDRCGGKKCKKKRYDKIVCINCQEESDTRTEKCEKCGEAY